MNTSVVTDRFIRFNQDVERFALPGKFTYPFYYEPHPLCMLAAQELQQQLQQIAGWDEHFGVPYEKKGRIIGKMFGVLLVRSPEGEIGYLAAFSGKLTDVPSALRFVPPVVDLQAEGHFFLEGEQELNAMNEHIDALERSDALHQARTRFEEATALSAQQLEALKRQIREGKADRKQQRAEGESTLSPEAYAALIEQLQNESRKEQFHLKDLGRYWKKQLADLQQPLDALLDEIRELKEERKRRSADLQQRLFDQYRFLNRAGEWKDLHSLFRLQPSSGTGECAAPRLLQYAFQNDLEPLAMAEFWWGCSPGSEVRRHGQFYPACRGKCEPILAHMLSGMAIDDDPVLALLGQEKTIATIYEDDYLLVIDKPAELLSIPGGTVEDSVESRMRARYPDATGPLMVHRLDMSTSGLMVVAKTKDVHEHLQRQFLRRTVKKSYTALLEGIVPENAGTIELPLILDPDDRPRQQVSFEFGRPAKTLWEVIERRNGRTRVRFYPVTGRTHQLRVHAAHELGLHTPIVGDELYGDKADRLHLHAEALEFRHPVTKEILAFQVEAPF